MKSATPFLPMSSASIRSLAMPRLLAGTPKDNKYISLSSKLELKGLVNPETASSTHSTLHLSRLICLFVFVALRPMSTAMVLAGRSVHLTTLFPGQA